MAKTRKKKTAKSPFETPLMRQYATIKGKYPDAILLFRVGDFYETFGKDAITASQTLGITLTKRNNGSASEIELAGFPYHALDTYLPKLVKAGFRIAICDQLEKPSQTKKLVKRGVTELVTPGIALSDKMLNHKENNYLASIHFEKKGAIGVSFLDASTGEFFVAEGNEDQIDKLVQSFKPSELLHSRQQAEAVKSLFGERFYTYPLEDWSFQIDFAKEILHRHFQVNSLKGFGVEELGAAKVAAGSILHYLGETAHPNIKHISSIARIHQERYVWLDRFTIRNLELLYPTYPGGTALIDVLDQTISPMGARLLKKWTILPLIDLSRINARHSMVEYILDQDEFEDLLAKNIKLIGDLERLIAKVPMGRVNPRQVMQIKRAIDAIEPIKTACADAKNEALNKIADQLNNCQLISDKIGQELVEEPVVQIGKGDVIAHGFNAELDELRALQANSKQFLVELQQRESERTGISSLKIGFNNVFGYYLEVRNRFKEQVPEEWIRKQTLVSSERYITAELKVYEEKIFGAEEKILALESRLFDELVTALAEYTRPIQLNAALIAQLDCILSFAKTAHTHQYAKPDMNEGLGIKIVNGRHPVIERQLDLGETYVPNSIQIDSNTDQMMVITGPNMSGKSALLRQTALVTLLAQMGSYVPAEKAEIGIVDKVFTRVGASDNISGGESTFMVEMNETASIMNNLSQRSLILLDEIGRGTSTYDGISIAWALAEYIHEHPEAKAKTLFATHYHELTELSNRFDRINNFHVSIKEVGNKVIFLRKLLPGRSDKSFGIHVAKMAGMPDSIVARANEILSELEQREQQVNTDGVEPNTSKGNTAPKEQSIPSTDVGKNRSTLQQLPPASGNYQLSFFDAADPKLNALKEAIEGLDVNTLTPIEALLKLNELKKLLG